MNKIDSIKQILSRSGITCVNIPDHRIDIIYDLFVKVIK
jgi:hypothetical protein